MGKFIGLFLLLVLSSSSVFAGNERLIGTWKSNKDGTLAYLKAHTHLTSQQLDVIAQSLGKMTITFDETNVILSTGTWTFASPYRVIVESKYSITIESKDPGNQLMTENEFEFSDGSLWSPDDRIPCYKERFDKLASK